MNNKTTITEKLNRAAKRTAKKVGRFTLDAIIVTATTSCVVLAMGFVAGKVDKYTAPQG